MSLVVAICGMAGSGKSTVREIFQEKGYEYLHLGVTEEAIRRFGKTNEEIERPLRNEMRQKYGMGAMAILSLESIKGFLSDNKKVVIDNMYSWSEYKIFKDEFQGIFISLAVLASPAIRYKRLTQREVRPQDPQTSQRRDYSEIEEIEKGGPIAMADYCIINESSNEHLHADVENILNKIENYNSANPY